MDDFSTYLIDQLKSYDLNLNQTSIKVLRKLVASYSFHLKICTWLNLPLRQWMLVMIGCLLGLVLVMFVLLLVLLDRVITVKCLERLFKKRLAFEQFNKEMAKNRQQPTDLGTGSIKTQN